MRAMRAMRAIRAMRHAAMSRRLQLTPAKTKLISTPWRVNLPANISGNGKRERHFFQSRQDAETFCRQQRMRLQSPQRTSVPDSARFAPMPGLRNGRKT